jgi:hypothetical protein
VPELGTLGSVRGALSNERPYRDPLHLMRIRQDSQPEDSNLCISKSDLLNFIVAQGRRSDARDFIKECRLRTAIRDAQVRVLPPRLRVMVNFDSKMQRFESCRPGLRVFANSDSEMQRFESSRPNRPVSL